MPSKFKKRRQLLKFDPLMLHLEQHFQSLKDHRRSNASYRLHDVLKAAFAMFSLKCPSLLSFTEQTKAEKSNLKTIYRIRGIPADTQMREILDPLAPNPLRDLFPTLINRLAQAGLLKEYASYQGYLTVAVDGVEHFCSAKVHCPQCLTRTHRNGQVSYYHAALAAVLLHPDHREVFPLDVEPIVRQDGESKNDCARNAHKRLVEALSERYPGLPILLVADALYANAPCLRRLREARWQFVLNVTPDGHKALFAQFESRRQRGLVKERVEVVKGVRHHYQWSNDLFLCDSGSAVKVNFLLYEETDAKGQVTRWTWITSFKLSAHNVERIMRTGRARWKIANETFNTLKNQGYHFEHNYGHGYEHLATILMLLMMLAFLVDQIQARYCGTVRQLQAGLKTLAKYWDSLRSVFRVLKFRTMEALYWQLASLYEIQLV